MLRCWLELRGSKPSREPKDARLLRVSLSEAAALFAVPDCPGGLVNFGRLLACIRGFEAPSVISALSSGEASIADGTRLEIYRMSSAMSVYLSALRLFGLFKR